MLAQFYYGFEIERGLVGTLGLWHFQIQKLASVSSAYVMTVNKRVWAILDLSFWFENC